MVHGAIPMRRNVSHEGANLCRPPKPVSSMASATRDHRLILLKLNSDGAPELRCVASDLSLEESMRIVRSGLARPRDVLIAGHPEQFALWLDTHTREDNGWNDQDRGDLESAITVWLHALRSCGALAFVGMIVGTTITVDRCYDHAPPLLFRYLRGLPPVIDDVEFQSTLMGTVQDAETNSTLGLLRDRVDTSRLTDWIRRVGYPQQLTCLRMPLFGLATVTELEAMHLRYAAWWWGEWRLMGAYPVCSVRVVGVDPSGRLVTATCVTLGMTPWSTETMWAALSNQIDPVFDAHRDVTKADPLNMPGQMDRSWHAMFRYQLQPIIGIHAFSRDFHRAIESALQEARLPLRIGLLESLDMESLDLACDMRQYNYLLGEGAADLKRNRSQAARIVPLLLDELTTGKAPNSRQAIDDGTPLFAAMAQDLGVPAWVAKRLPAVRLSVWHAVGFASCRAPVELARLIEQCGAAAPQLDLPAISALQQLLKTGRDLATGPEARELLRQLVLGMAGREAARAGWRSVLSIMGMTRYIDMTRPIEFADGTEARRDLHDYLAYVLEAIKSANHVKLARYYDDARCLSARTSAALVQLMKGLALSDLQRLVLRWHEALRHLDGTAVQRRLDLALRGGTHLGLHPPTTEVAQGAVELILPPCVLSRSGYHIEQLVHMEDLRREGSEMQHCVLTYAGRVAGGQCLLVRLRHPGGLKRATLEFRYVLTMEGGKWQLEQAKARKNHKPDPETAIAAVECLQFLNRLSSELAPERLAPYAIAPRSASTGYPEFAVLEALMDSKRGRRWLPGPSSVDIRERLRQAFDASAMPSIQLLLRD
jgi:hypothetical protein